MSSPETDNPLDALVALDALERTERAELDRPISTDLVLAERRELAVQAVDMIAEVLEVDVTVGALMRLAADEEPSTVRLRAKRALRCVEAVGREDSEVVRVVGRASLYHFVEGTITFGASERTYLGLMELYRLNAEQATALYALRRGVAEQCDDQIPGFPTLMHALARLGISPQEAAADTDAALAAMQEAGFFVDHTPKRTFSSARFWPQYTADKLVNDVDSTRDYEQRHWLRQQFEADEPGAEEAEE